jgi:hypothetical protein
MRQEVADAELPHRALAAAREGFAEMGELRR